MPGEVQTKVPLLASAKETPPDGDQRAGPIRNSAPRISALPDNLSPDRVELGWARNLTCAAVPTPLPPVRREWCEPESSWQVVLMAWSDPSEECRCAT